MERPYISSTQRDARGYVVRGAGPGDIMTGSLKAAYGRDKALPDDMARLMGLLNRIPE